MTTLTDKLKEISVEMTATFDCVTDEDTFQWSVTLRRNGRELTTPFTCGSNYRRFRPGHKGEESRMGTKLRFWAGSPLHEWVDLRTAVANKFVIPTEPALANVVYCLLMDATALEQTFDEWCGDFGYDTDSRKAYDLYTRCVDSSRHTRRLFPEWQELLELEH